MAPWRPFVRAWAETYGTEPVRTRELQSMAVRLDLLAGVMGDGYGNDRSQQTRLGAALSRYVDRIVDGFKIVRRTADYRPGFALEKVS